MTSVVPLAVTVGAGQSGPIGLLVVLVLCALCVLLFRSMTKQLKRVPSSFDTPNSRPATSQGATPPDDRADA